MRVPSYQIYNILNIFSKWVSRKGNFSIEKFNGDPSRFDRANILADRYRKSIMQKVTGNIVSKITCIEPNGGTSQKITEKPKNDERLDENNGSTFVFNSIDKNSKKTTNQLSIDTSNLLAKYVE
jgi:hypothetical protein